MRRNLIGTRSVIFIRGTKSVLDESATCGIYLTKQATIMFTITLLLQSRKIVHILGALDKKVAKILTKGFTKMQDSHHEFQELIELN